MREFTKSVVVLIAGVLANVSLAGGAALTAGATWHDLWQPVPVLMMLGNAATAIMLWVVKGYAALVNK